MDWTGVSDVNVVAERSRNLLGFVLNVLLMDVLLMDVQHQGHVHLSFMQGICYGYNLRI